MLKALCLFVTVIQVSVWSQYIGRSFYKFSGPLRGPVEQIHVQGIHGPSFDYIAKPDYTYSYGVSDPKTENSQSRRESRDGDSLRGEYSLLEADGTVRVVQYTADPHRGFHATVHYKHI